MSAKPLETFWKIFIQWGAEEVYLREYLNPQI